MHDQSLYQRFRGDSFTVRCKTEIFAGLKLFPHHRAESRIMTCMAGHMLKILAQLCFGRDYSSFLLASYIFFGDSVRDPPSDEGFEIQNAPIEGFQKYFRVRNAVAFEKLPNFFQALVKQLLWDRFHENLYEAKRILARNSLVRLSASVAMFLS